MNNGHFERDLLLLGGGHSHALALLMLAMQPPSNTRLTLVSPASFTPYSGMLPGLVAGHYQFADTHIDLARLCDRLNVRFIRAAATGIDSNANELLFEDRPALGFDLLSIDIGAQPGWSGVAGASELATPVKPVHSFYQRWQATQRRIAALPAGKSLRIVVVGGGAGSVEIALAMRYSIDNPAVTIRLVGAGHILADYNARARAAVYRACAASGVELTEQTRVTSVAPDALATASGTRVEYDELFWCTGAVAAPWLEQSGLPVTDGGFLRVEDTLQVCGMPALFAAGDVATQMSQPRPKAGVFAVRQAPLLAANLRAALEDQPLRRFAPQRRFLSLLALGERRAVANRGWLAASGGWVWRWKDYIDRSFMARFSEAKAVMPGPAAAPAEAMHCGGCGAKVPAQLLRSALADLAARYPQVVAVEDLREDAALVDIGSGGRIYQSVDILRQLIDDPWLMGRIATLHALSDLYAMGAKPHSALCSLTLPYAGPRLQGRDLGLLLAGVVHELDIAGCRLLGGHTLEGPELNLGLTVNGLDEGQLLAKQELAVGDQLVLCKPLGTGALFAAQQQGLAQGDWIEAATDSMLLSNRAAAQVATVNGVKAATDITGFGLAGHALEMLAADSGLQIRLQLDSLPLLPGLEQVLALPVVSTLQPGNIASCAGAVDAALLTDPRAGAQALFDPQTSGGLLLAVPPQRCDALLAALHQAGYPQAQRIGEVAAAPAAGPLLIES